MSTSPRGSSWWAAEEGVSVCTRADVNDNNDNMDDDNGDEKPDGNVLFK